MRIELLDLRIENFKGIRKFRLYPDGDNITVRAENGRGKTTIYDAFLWLLFGKNSEGKSDFPLRPLDADNNAIKGLMLSVEATLSIDGISHTLCREQHEKITEKVEDGKTIHIVSYPTKYEIDEVPKLKKDYDPYIRSLVSEDIFRMVTDLTYFNSLHWSKQRAILDDFAEDVGKPKGFDELMRSCNGRDVKDYEDVLKTRKKSYAEERDEINPSLNERHNVIKEIGTVDTKDAGTQRAAAITKKADLQEQKTKLIEGETARQKKVDALNTLKAERTVLENTLRQGDLSKIGPLLREKLSWDELIAVKRDELSTLRKSISDAEIALADTENQLTQKTSRWSLVCDEYRELKAATLDELCSVCRQKLPVYTIAELKRGKAEKMAKAAFNATGLKEQKEALLVVKMRQKDHRDKLTPGILEGETELAKLLEEKESGLAEIEKKITAAKEGINPEDDNEWKRLAFEIRTSEMGLGVSLMDGMIELDIQIEACQKNIDAANLILANTDTIKKNKDRITELEAREKELAQLIADIEQQLADIGKYKAEESRLIEAAVNGKFKHVKFKLFETLLNGSIEDTCVAMLDGKPYPAMSSGEKIFVGIDIVNVLSEHYGVSVVMFIDHLESLTLPIETDAQVIGLYAEKGTTELTVKGK